MVVDSLFEGRAPRGLLHVDLAQKHGEDEVLDVRQVMGVTLAEWITFEFGGIFKMACFLSLPGIFP